MRKTMAVCLLAGVLSAGQGIQIDIPYTQFKLPNGLNVILHEDHSIPLVSVNVWYHVGSGREMPGRTGFAHLFEHLMFEGSAHVPEGMFDVWLEGAGGYNNGSTMEDRTNYWENIPSNALSLALFLESDRMGHFLDVVSPDLVDGQRDVVKNERRQSYENQPYGMAWLTIPELVYEPAHPYSWPVIGSQADLSAASLEDVKSFFTRYYGPGNASLAVAGDIDPATARAQIEHWFSDVPAGAPVQRLEAPQAVLNVVKHKVLEDDVQLPRLLMLWITPGFYQPGDAEMDIIADILTSGKNSRLYRRMVYELEIAQEVFAFQESLQLSSLLYVVATARSGHTLAELESVILEEIALLKTEAPTERELDRAVNQHEAGMLRSLERVGGFGGKGDRLNRYYFYTGTPGYINNDLARYKALTTAQVSAAAGTYLKDDGRVVLSVVPKGRTDLAAVPEEN
ncbi:MAG: pitrilysin family protein [Candidatus Neomarinimicrobiota bacterium]